MMARETGLEPATSGVTGRRFCQDFNVTFDSFRDKSVAKNRPSTLRVESKIRARARRQIGNVVCR